MLFRSRQGWGGTVVIEEVVEGVGSGLMTPTTATFVTLTRHQPCFAWYLGITRSLGGWREWLWWRGWSAWGVPSEAGVVQEQSRK